MTEVACLEATAPYAEVTMISTFSRTNSAAISAMRSLRPSPPILDRNGAPLNPAEFGKPLREGGNPFAVGFRRTGDKKSNGRQSWWLLGASIQRPHSHCTAKQRDELASLHLSPKNTSRPVPKA